MRVFLSVAGEKENNHPARASLRDVMSKVWDDDSGDLCRAPEFASVPCYLSIVVYCPWNCSRNGLAFIASPLRDPGELMTVQSGRLVCLNESKEGPSNPDLSRFSRDGLRRIPDYPARDRTTPMVPRPSGSPPASTSRTHRPERSTGAASTRLL
jgi:hypothetical protein